MKIYDTLIKITENASLENSRERRGCPYSYCHHMNAEAIASGKSEHYFVFSNALSQRYVIRRSLEEPTDLGVTVAYDIEDAKYSDMICFQGFAENAERQYTKFSSNYVRYIFNNKAKEPYNLKIIAASSNGKRPFNIARNLFKSVVVTDEIKGYILKGHGAKISYGCGLVIPEKVYNHLLNFVS
jgi:hypothetical protein